MATCEQLTFVIVGHVDHGKSTVIGRFLCDMGALSQGKLEQVRQYCEKHARPFEYAFLLDSLRDEQAQGITIDTTRIFFKSSRRRYMILDAPGHIEFLRNMVTGAAKADAALLVIDAKEGIRENSKRHGVLLSLLGIKQVAVLVNKMDLVEYSQAHFEQIRKDYSGFLSELGMTSAAFVPIAAYRGENLCVRSPNMAWYEGPLVFDVIENFAAPTAPDHLPFRMPVQDIYKFTESGDNRRIIAGTVESGTLSVGDTIVFAPSGKKTRVEAFETFSAEAPAQALAGQAVGFRMSEQVYVKRGQIACKLDESVPKTGSRITASLFWLGRNPMVLGKRYVLKLGTARCEAELVELNRVVDTQRLAVLAANQVNAHEIADCVLDLDHAIAFDLSDEHPILSRFVLFDGFDMSGGGVIRSVHEDPHSRLKQRIAFREHKWESSLIEQDEREARNGHRSFLVIVTGGKETPRKEVAKELERKLFDTGHSVYFVGFGSLIYGIGSRVASSEQTEKIRLAAELAQVCLDAGMILVLSLQYLSQEEFELFRMSMRGRPIRTAWLGSQIDSDLRPDLHLASDLEVTQTAGRIFDDLRKLNWLRGIML